MLRTRLLVALLGSLLLSSASWANEMGYVDCAKHPDDTQVLDKGGMTNGVVAILPCGERFTVLVRGVFYAQIQTKDGKVGYVQTYLISTDTSAASKPKPSATQAPTPSASASAAAALPADMTVISRGQSGVPTTAPAPSAAPSQSASASNLAPSGSSAPQPAVSAPSQHVTASAASAPTAQVAPAASGVSSTATATPSSASALPAAGPAQTEAPAAAPAPAPVVSTSASSAPASQPEPAAPAATVAIAPPQPAAPSQTGSTTSVESPAAPASSAPVSPAPVAQPEPPAPAPSQPATTIAAPVFTPKAHPARQKKPQPFPDVSNVPMFEVFAGYGFTRFGNSGTGSNLNGALGSFGFNVMSRLQIIGDASYNFVTVNGTKNVLYGDHFGPRFFLRSRSAHGPIPFVEGLIGGSRIDSTTAGVTASQNGITYKGGGGVDLNISPRFVVRIVDADYYRVPFLTGSVNNYSASAGIVFRFGGSRPQY